MNCSAPEAAPRYPLHLLVLMTALCLLLPWSPAASAEVVVVAQDSFTRTVAAGWGVADTGGPWTSCATCSVSGGRGRTTLAKGSGAELLLSSVSSTDNDVTAGVSVDRMPTGGGTYFSLVARGTAGSGYRGKVRMLPNGALALSILRMQAWTETALASTELPSPTVAVGSTLMVRMQAIGAAPSSLKLKVWRKGTAEPVGWQVNTTDSTATLQSPGSVGLFMYLSGSTSNGPTTLDVDDFSVRRDGVAPNQPPVAAFTTQTKDLTVAVDATSSADPDGAITDYLWHFGDGNTATGVKPAPHAYSRPGNYLVTLTVTDTGNATATRSSTIAAVAPSPTVPKVGAQLPVQYDPSTIPADAKYVAPKGSDATGNGSLLSPFASVQKALNSSAAGGTVIVRGGNYPTSGTFAAITKPNVVVKAYPGETPVFDYTIPGSTGFQTEGALRYAPYSEMPRASGLGMAANSLPVATFINGVPSGLAADRGFACVSSSPPFSITAPSSQSASGCNNGSVARVVTGFFPDQMWLRGTRLTQVSDKGKVRDGMFYVSVADNRVYLSATDAATAAADPSGWRTSNSSQSQAQGLLITTSGVTVKGLRIHGFSSTWGYTPIYLNETSANNTFDSLLVTDAAAQGVHAGGTTSRVIQGATLRNTTIQGANWVGMVGSYIDDLTVKESVISNTNADKEFDFAPVSGAIKLSKADRTRITGNDLLANTGHTLWFDQSCYQAVVASNRILGSSHSSLFFEISHGLTMVNNFVKPASNTKEPVIRLASGGDIRLVNNTLVGGANSISMIADPRSGRYDSDGNGTKDRWCAEHAFRYDGSSSFAACDTRYNDIIAEDFDRARSGAFGSINRTPGMDWQMDVVMLVNNVMAMPTGGGDTNTCSADTNLCVRTGGVFQLANSAWGSILTSSTIADGNLYDNNDITAVVNTDGGTYTPHRGIGAWRSILVSAPVSNPAAEAAGVSGSGLVDSNGALLDASSHSRAAAVPKDSRVNEFVPAGTRHYGWLG